MEKSRMTSARKKKIKTVLSMMNKQNQRFIPIAQPLVEMMDMVTTDAELDYAIKMGTKLYDSEQAVKVSNMSNEDFQLFFDTMKRKGLVHIEHDSMGKETYRLNAIAVGWYEAMMHYIVGKPQEKAFSEKWNEYFKFFYKFNFAPLRNVQNVVLRTLIKPSQDTAIMDPAVAGKTKRKTIPINTTLSVADSTAYRIFYVTELIEEYGNQNTIYAFPCVCRHGNTLIDSPCGFDMPKESCIAFGNAKAWQTGSTVGISVRTKQ